MAKLKKKATTTSVGLTTIPTAQLPQPSGYQAPSLANEMIDTKGKMRTDRHNNPTAMTTDVARTLGLTEGVDYTVGDPFGGGRYFTAKLAGDPIATTTKALDLAASTGRGAFYTQSGKPRWSYIAMSDQEWLSKTPEQKKQVIAQMYKREGGSGELLKGGASNPFQNLAKNINAIRQSPDKPTDTDILNKISQKYPDYAQKIQLARQNAPAGVSDREIVNKIVEKYGGKATAPSNPLKTTSATQQATEPTQRQYSLLSEKPQPKDGFLKTVAKEIVKPIAELGVTAFNLPTQIGATIGEGIKKAKTGQDLMTGYTDVLSQSRSLPFLGETKPAFTGKETATQSLMKQIGYGAELGSYLPFGKAIGAGVNAGVAATKAPLKTAAIQGFKSAGLEGLIGGGLSGVSQAIRDEDGIPSMEMAGKIAGYGALGSVAGGALSGAMGLTFPLVGKTFSAAVLPKETKIANKITDVITTGVDKGIKPTGKKPAVMANYHQKAQDGILAIFDNKNQLNILDDAGQKVNIPQNLDQFKDAITETMGITFKRYDDLLTTAGEAGAKIDLNPLAKELDKVISNKPIQMTQPSAVREATRWKEIINNIQTLDLKNVNETIKILNQELKAFYRNPQYDQVSIAGVKEGVARNLRKLLDEKVNSFTGGDFQMLKSIYGSLRMLEDDVVKRATVVARQSDKGFWDLPSAFARGDILSGLLTLRPAAVARGVTLEGVSRYFKYLNNPNTAIKKMFQKLDDLYTPKPYKAPVAPKPAGLLPQYSMKSPSKGALTIIPGQGRTTPMPLRQQPGLRGTPQGQVKSPSDLRVGIKPKKSNTSQTASKPLAKTSVGIRPTRQLSGAALGIQPETDEEGKIKGIKFDPKMAMIGLLGTTVWDRMKKNPQITKQIAADVLDKTSNGQEIINNNKVRSSFLRYVKDFDGSTDSAKKIKELADEFLFRRVDKSNIDVENKKWFDSLSESIKDIYNKATQSVRPKVMGVAPKQDLYTQLTKEISDTGTRVVSKDRVLNKANELVPSALSGNKEDIKTLRKIYNDFMVSETVKANKVTRDTSLRDKFLNSLGKNKEVMMEILDGKKIDQKLTPFDTPEVIKARQNQAKVQQTIFDMSPERVKLREEVTNKLYGTGAKNKKQRLDLVLGLPGSGKSSVVADPLAQRHGSIIIDADQAKGMLGSIKEAGALHQESSDIVEKGVLMKAMQNNDNIVLPLVGKTESKVKSIIDKFKSKGYSVNLHYVDISVDEAAKRSVKRFETTGRFTDPLYVLEVGDKPGRTFNNLKKEVNDFISYDNSGKELKVVKSSMPDFSKKSSLDRLKDIDSDYMITTPENPLGVLASKEHNEISREGFESFLRRNRISFKKQIGKYGGTPETSYLIKINNPKERTLIDGWLEKTPQQENIIIKNGVAVRYDPRTRKAYKVDLNNNNKDISLADDVDDYYSEIEGNKYSLPLYSDDEQEITVKEFLEMYNK